MVNGLELGREIRRLDREAQIIYATTEPQFALQAYAASPINYLIKPVDKQQLFDTLTLAISKTDLTEEQTFAVKTADSLRIVKLSDIACCEYRSHAVIFTLANGEEVLSRTIRENYSEYISPILKNRHFLQCHTAFVVNMCRVERFSKDSFMGRYLYVIDFAAARPNYTITRQFAVNDTTLPTIANYDNVGYLDIKAGTEQQQPISFASGSVSKYVADGAFTNVLTNPNGTTAAYASSNTSVATVATDGTVTIKAAGSSTITATSSKDGTSPVYASFTLTVTKEAVTVTVQDKTIQYSDVMANGGTLTLSINERALSQQTADETALLSGRSAANIFDLTLKDSSGSVVSAFDGGTATVILKNIKMVGDLSNFALFHKTGGKLIAQSFTRTATGTANVYDLTIPTTGWSSYILTYDEGSNPFTDVASDSYYYDAVLWALDKGITSGTTATTFVPDAICTRAQAATFLWRAMNTKAVDYYVSFDNYTVGVLQGQFVVDKLGLDVKDTSKTYNIEFTAGDPADNNAGFFFNGAFDTLKPFIDAGILKIVSGQSKFEEVATASWDTTTAMNRMQNILASYYSNGTQLDVALCSNDSTALGVTQAIESDYAGKNQPIITGQDGDEANLANIIDGKQSMGWWYWIGRTAFCVRQFCGTTDARRRRPSI